MSTLTLAFGQPTLADRIFSRRLVTDILLVASGAALTSLAAQLVIPLWPVPITGQTFAVLLVGATLGAARGAISLALYAALGIFLPIYSGSASGLSALFGGSGGYIFGFIIAAALVGWLAQLKWDHRFLKTLIAFIAGSAVIYAVGVPWLAVSYGLPAGKALELGLYPFLIGDAIKAILAAIILPLTWRAIAKTDGAEHDAAS